MRRLLLSGMAATLAATAVVPLQPGPARATDQPCPVAMPAGTVCGLLTVPERRGVPGSRTIQVAYAVHRSTAADRKPDPIVYTSGGPGSSSLQLTRLLSGAPFGRDRDVVVLEQRGSRWSRPYLHCPEVDRGLLDSLSRAGHDEEESRMLSDSGRACRNRMEAEGVDLRGYRTSEIAADVVALRKVLGYRTWNLFGVSYSTRSMVAAAATDPGGVRAIVLDSYLPARTRHYEVTIANLLRTLEQVRPGLSVQLRRMVDRLNEHPATVEVTDPQTHRPRALRLTGDDVASLVGEGMQDADVVTVVPPLLQALADGHDELLTAVGQVATDNLVSHDTGVYYAVNCQDEIPFNTVPDGGTPRSFFNDADPAVCRGLGLPAGSDAAPTAGAPTLILGGSVDAATPIDTARAAAAATVPNATVAEFAGVAHAVFLTSRCGRETIAAFLATPAGFAAPCDPAASPYRTRAPGELYVTSRAYGVAAHPWPTLLAPAVLLAACVAVLVIAAARRRPLLALGALGGPAFLGAAVWLFRSVASTNPASLMVGVPPSLAWCSMFAGLAPVLAGVATAVRRRTVPVPALLITAGATHLVWWCTG